MAGDSQDPGLRHEKIGGHDEMKGSWWRRRRGAGGQGRELDVIPSFGSAIGEVDLLVLPRC